MKTLDRYISRELVGPFAVGLLAFVVLITGHILFTVIQVVVEHGVALTNVARFVFLQVPGAAVLALPVSSLLASSLALNRLSSEQELTAMRCAGIPLSRIVRPAMALGLVASAASLCLNETAVPWAERESQALMRRMIVRERSLAFKPNQFVDTGQGVAFYVGQVDRETDTLHYVRVFLVQPKDPPVLVQAAEARFTRTGVELGRCQAYFADSFGRFTGGPARSITIDLSRPEARELNSGVTIRGMTMLELLQQYRHSEAAARGAGSAFSLELNWRLALALSCFVFAALAGPVTLRFGRGQNLVGVLATIVSVFVYYVLMLWLKTLGGAGKLPVPVAAWSLDVGLLTAALLGIWRFR
jgi:lipopolysaccharide export system permease protein